MFEGKVCQLPNDSKKRKGVDVFRKRACLALNKRQPQSEASTIATTSLNAAEKANLASAGFRRDLSSLHI